MLLGQRTIQISISAKSGSASWAAARSFCAGANANPVVYERLVQVAQKKKIPYQIQAEPGGTGTDANAIQLSRAGVATGLVSVPQRYMHTPVEIASLEPTWTTPHGCWRSSR